MRIVTGTAKGIRLATLEGNETRPTSERVKEAIFSSLQFDIEGRRVLDLFAGSGQMGLEAMSRGAESVCFVDASHDAMQIVKQNAEKTGFFKASRFSMADYRNFVRKAGGKDTWNLVFIDPPYHMDCVGDALERILRAKIVPAGGIVVTESGHPDIFRGHEEIQSRFAVVKAARYSISYVTILRVLEDEA